MKAKKISESLEGLLQPKSIKDIIKSISHLSVQEQINELENMQKKWGDLYDDLLNHPEIIQELRSKVKKELDKKDILEKVNYIETLEHKLPDLFSGLKDQETINELKEYIINQPLEEKTKLVYRFFKTWPDLFEDVEVDETIDDETNQLLLLFKIKAAIDQNQIDEIQKFVQKLGEKYGRDTLLDKAQHLYIDSGRFNHNLFNKKDLEQLKLTLYKETRSEEEQEQDELFNVYAFIPYEDYKEVEIDGETFHKKRLGIENLVKIDKYDSSSLAQVNMMKIRANHQYGSSKVYGVYIPKFMWDKDYAYNDEIPDKLRKFIDEHKFNL